MTKLAALVLGAVLVGTACGGSDDAEPVRPPLGSPPDPGEVPDDHGLSASRLDSVAASTVRITGIACGRTSEGSGFAVSDRLIATNAHVLVGVDEPFVEQSDGTTIPGHVVAFDTVRDLALLRVDDATFRPLPLGTASDGTVGAVFGWDAGPMLEVTPFRVNRPITVRIEEVAASTRIDRPSWLVAANIESGDSGAALVDADGTVIGIAYATSTKEGGVGYAVRADELTALIDEGLDESIQLPDC